MLTSDKASRSVLILVYCPLNILKTITTIFVPLHVLWGGPELFREQNHSRLGKGGTYTVETKRQQDFVSADIGKYKD